MRKLYIVVDLMARKAIFQSHNLQSAQNYITCNSQDRKLYLVILTVEQTAFDVVNLEGKYGDNL